MLWAFIVTLFYIAVYLAIPLLGPQESGMTMDDVAAEVACRSIENAAGLPSLACQQGTRSRQCDLDARNQGKVGNEL